MIDPRKNKRDKKAGNFYRRLNKKRCLEACYASKFMQVWIQKDENGTEELDKLSENFKVLFEDKETCDVTLKVKEKEYKAHTAVLIARSSVFAANFKYDTLEKQTGVITIPDCDPDSFQKFLEYLYCGKFEELSPHSAQSLYYTSDKYDVEELKEFCVEYLMQCLTVENMCEIVVFADKFEKTTLFSAIQEFFNKNLYNILASPEWESLQKKDYRLANKLLLQMAKGKHKE